MLDFFYNLSDNTWDEKELDAINKVVKSGKFTMGENVRNFETEFAKFSGTKYAIMSNSGSSANLLAVAALYYSKRLQKGDEVIVPAVSWSTTYFPLTQYGLKLVFVDIDLDTLNMSTSKIEAAITNKTKALFAVNLLGNPNNFDEIMEICDKFNLILLEDNCESLGATYNNKQAGSFGILGTYSSFHSHHISTMEGGITVTDDKNLYDIMLSLRAHGWTRNLDSNSTIYTKNIDDFYESFNFILPGYNLRPLEFEGAIGIEQIKKIPRIVEQRRLNAEFFKLKISRLKNFQTQKEVGRSSWFGFAILLRGRYEGKRKFIIEYLTNNGIELRPIVAGNFTRNPVINLMDYRISETLENSTYIHENGFFVGNHSIDNREKLEHLFNLLEGLENDKE